MGTVVPKLEHEAKIRLGILIAVTKMFLFFLFFSCVMMMMYDNGTNKTFYV